MKEGKFFQTEPNFPPKNKEGLLFEEELKELANDPDAPEGIETIISSVRELSDDKKEKLDIALNSESVFLGNFLSIAEEKDIEPIEKLFSDFSQSSGDEEKEILKELVDKIKRL